jgi:hypothetical protein
LKNYRKAKRKGKDVKIPRARKLVAKLGNQAYKIVGNTLRIPIKPRQYFCVELHKQARQFLKDPTIKLGAITITTSSVIVSFSRNVNIVEPKGFLAIDVNEDNITVVDSDKTVKVYDLSHLRSLRYGYFWRRRKLQQKYHKDRRF